MSFEEPYFINLNYDSEILEKLNFLLDVEKRTKVKFLKKFTLGLIKASKK
jgi:hypothetical protein